MRQLVVVAIALAIAAPAGAAPAPDALVVSSPNRLHLVDQLGAVTGTISGFSAVAAADWSPDGTRFVFLDVSAGRRLFVAAADGSNVHEVAVGEGVVGSPVWVSPSEIATLRNLPGASGDSLWIVPVDGGSPRLLATGTDANQPLVMQPHGSLLLYSVAPMGLIRRAIIDVRSGVSTLLPSLPDAVWSPDGSRLAAPTRDGIETLRPDGTDRRTVVAGLGSANVPPVSWLGWSPDGRRIAFTRRQPFPELTNRYGTPIRTEVYSVAVDGSELVRLTGVSGDDLFAGGSSGGYAPAWWPDGTRLFFKRGGQEKALTMNADGSCETPWLGPAAFAYPLWRPGAIIAPGRLECSSVTVRLRTPLAEVSHRAVLPLTVVIRNDGTRTLRDVRLSLETGRGTLVVPSRACETAVQVACPLGDVGVGRELALQVETRFRDVGRTRVTASVSYAGGGDIDPADDTVVVERDVSPCDILGTWGADRLIGTARGEWICARPGWDYIDARGGNDTIDAGSGVDTVIAGPGRDVVNGGGGGDTIRVRDGQRDVVDCGTETDVVIADRKDVLRHCERVQRR
jgi:hypothetical protein